MNSTPIPPPGTAFLTTVVDVMYWEPNKKRLFVDLSTRI